MKRISQSRVTESLRPNRFICLNQQQRIWQERRSIHNSAVDKATVYPITAAGPPPSAPLPSADHIDSRVARRKQQAELLKRGQDLRALAGGKGGGTAKQKRFWKDVHVKKVDDGYQILLDSRPLRAASKSIITIPFHKPHLASAIALEWDLLVSAQQALRHHLIPLTSLVSRAMDISNSDSATKNQGEIRKNIVTTLMRYLDTDSLLCWAPTPPPDPPGYERHVSRTESLRSIQKREAERVMKYLTERVWPGVEIVPVLEEGSIFPVAQPELTRGIIQGWISGLPAWELAGLERAVMAGKGLLGAVRLLVEWSAELSDLREEKEENEVPFGIEEAARIASLEVKYQTDMWGEVEDTHDVANEDLKRQLGQVILLVSGVRP